jgi:hypothetical protein
MLNFKPMAGIRFVAKLTVANGALQIELGFWERLGSFSRNQSIRLSEIAEVSYMEKVSMSIFGYRVVGTGLPGVVVLGHFRKSKKRMMVYWVRGQQALILDLKTGPYKRMIIGCSDAKALAKELELGV